LMGVPGSRVGACVLDRVLFLPYNTLIPHHGCCL
jgi:hypothetical protein